MEKCRSAELTIELIKGKYKTLRGIHIFSHKMATKDSLLKLFRHYRELRTITLNCQHEFEVGLLFALPKEYLGRIENLELKWDFNRFFKDYQIYKYFPTKRQTMIERVSPNNVPVDFLQMLPENQSLLITSEKKIDDLQEAHFSFDKIRALHFTKGEEQSKEHPNLAKLLPLHQLRSLTALNLSGTG